VNWKNKLLDFDSLTPSEETLQGLVFDVQRFATHDGGGIRTNVFLKGCPLSCQWCSNPESINRELEISYIANNCINCRKCLQTCPNKALGTDTSALPFVDRERCDLCGECLKVCYAGALNVIGRYISVPELLAIIERDRGFYLESSGGVTFSGGEPTAQGTFLQAILQQCRQSGIHTAIETSAFLGWPQLCKILLNVDLALIDIKHIEDKEHRRLTGVSNRQILHNLKRIGQLGVPVRIRLPLIPGVNDTTQVLLRTAEFVRGLSNVQGVDLLPYHRLGQIKWEQLNRPYILKEIRPHSGKELEEKVRIFQRLGLKARIGG